MRRLPVPPARSGSHEDLLHRASPRPSFMVFPERRDSRWLSARRGHRAIGVVYHPEVDRTANWVRTVMGRRYDAFCYFEQTEAVEPLRFQAVPAGGEPATERATEPWGT